MAVEAETEDEAIRLAAATFIRDQEMSPRPPVRETATTDLETAGAARILTALAGAKSELMLGFGSYTRADHAVQHEYRTELWSDVTKWMLLDRQTLQLRDLGPLPQVIVSVQFFEPNVFRCQWSILVQWMPVQQHWLLKASVYHTSYMGPRKPAKSNTLLEFPERTATTIDELDEQLQALVQEVIASRERIDARAGTVKPAAE